MWTLFNPKKDIEHLTMCRKWKTLRYNTHMWTLITPKKDIEYLTKCMIVMIYRDITTYLDFHCPLYRRRICYKILDSVDPKSSYKR